MHLSLLRDHLFDGPSVVYSECHQFSISGTALETRLSQSLVGLDH